MAILRLCEQMRIKGIILASAGYSDDEKNHGWDWKKIKSNTQWIEQFHSADDPFTPVESSRHIAGELQSTYHEFNDRNHFLCPEFPDIVDVIKRRCQLS
jgi:pimeloyl-ACP methyl ester carboxylesterase